MSSDLHRASTITSSGLKQPYHLVDPSPWPILGAFTGGSTLAGLVLVSHYHNYWLLVLGLLGTLGVMYGWWRDVLKESGTPGLHSVIVRLGLRYGVIM